jgi:hypothetical protein
LLISINFNCIAESLQVILNDKVFHNTEYGNTLLNRQLCRGFDDIFELAAQRGIRKFKTQKISKYSPIPIYFMSGENM